MQTKKPVLVTTERRGVFFGYLVERTEKSIKLEGARCAIRFGTTGGFLELAATGPTSSSKIGARASLELTGITSVSDVTPAAVEAWERA